jgi:GTP-binding protein
MENFIDYVKIMGRSGHGGAGCSHFHREKFIRKGGPDGGDGGRGGHIILKGNKQLWTLLHLKYRKHIFAEDGEKGGSALCSGKSGEDIILEVPLGTVARDFETGEIMCEINEHGQKAILLPGGIGGQGNYHFRSPTNQSPTYAQPGRDGVEKWVVMELKLLADVGLVGFPNAGKSTLLSVVSAARPQIADYAFTTLVPGLGMVYVRDSKSFVMADIPGIIEGAAEGRGLGVRFLKHIERNACLLFMVPIDADDIIGQYKILLKELKKFNPELLLKDRMLAISKSDLVDEETRQMIEKDFKKRLPRKQPIDYIFISSATGYNVDRLKDMLYDKVSEAKG